MLWLTLLCAVLWTQTVKQALCCGPQLQESLWHYFGQGFILKNFTTGYTNDYIMSASDLNCDFSKAEICRWNNSELDNFEWYIGEGSATRSGWITVFGVSDMPTFPFGFAPSGPRGEGESAWIVSSPIRCQRGTGKLTFNYYGRNAYFQVCIVEPFTLTTIACTPANAYGTGQPGPFSWFVPAQEKDFQLAIKAFHYTIAPGGLIAVDNIMYDADVCRSSDIRRRGSYTNAIFPDGLTGQAFTDAAEVNCDFSTTCRWGNKQTQNDVWALGSGNPGNTLWESNTGTDVLPVEPWAVIHGPEGAGPDVSSWLYTDYFYCQNSDGLATFNYWLSKGAKLQLCTLDQATNATLWCSVAIETGSPGPAQITIPGPINQSFRLGVRAFNFQDPDGAFAAIDDFKYTAIICKNTRDLGGSLLLKPLVSGVTGQDIEHASDLNCQFSRSDCRWGNTVATASWMNATGIPDYTRWQRATGVAEIPASAFAMMPALLSPGYEAILKSDPIACQTGDGKLTFKFWMSDKASMKVCAQLTGEDQDVHCEFLDRNDSPGVKTITIPGDIMQDFYLSFRATSPEVDHFAAINDITYTADICSKTNPGRALGGTLSLQPLANGLTGNYLLQSSDADCTFDATCRYGNSNNDVQWMAATGNPNAARWSMYTGSTAMPSSPFSIVPLDGTGGIAAVVTDPIVCQKGDGTLKFKYWGTSGSQLQVCAIGATNNQTIVCQTVSTSSSGPVTVTIPGDIRQDFRLTFRATNDKPGFVAIDDITYDADFCKADLGGSLNLNPFPNGLTGNYITQSGQANCGFDATCRWGSTGSLPFQIATGAPDQNRWKLYTGQESLPSNFAMAKVDSTGEASIRTDPIACQNGNGVLKFKFYSTDKAQLKVCTEDLASKTTLSCSSVDRSQSPGPVSVTIPGDIDKDFYIAFHATGQDSGDFVAIDDVTYSADICDGSKPIGNLGGTFSRGALPSGLTGAYLDNTKELTCGFQFGTEPCRYGNLKTQQSMWQLGSGSPKTSRWSRYIGQATLPSGPFGVASFDGPGADSAILTSDPMRCQRGSGTFAVTTWVTDGVSLQLCADSMATGQAILCLPVRAGQQVITVPGDISQPFTISLRANGTKSGFAAVDSLSYTAQLCQRTVEQRPVTTNSTQACRKLKCDFENDECSANYNVTFTGNGWKRTNARYGPALNQLIGQKDGGKYYLGSPTISYGQRTVLGSQPFAPLDRPIELRFSYMRGTYGTKLSVCFEPSLQACTIVAPFGLTIEEATGFKLAKVTLPAGTSQIFFVYDHEYASSGQAVVAIDVITVFELNSNTEVC